MKHQKINETTEPDSSLKGVETDESGEYTLYGYRWVFCAAFAASLVASGLQMVGFAPVGGVFTECYNNVSGFQVSLLVLVYIVVFVPLNFPANKLIDSGLRIPVSLSRSHPLDPHCFSFPPSWVLD